MFLKEWIKQLGPCIINRSIESTNEIMKVIDNIQHDSAIVVIVNLNHEEICISLVLKINFIMGKTILIFHIEYDL